MEFWQVLLLFGIGIVAGMINVTAGGGSSLTLPALIFLGLDSALANGTNRIAIFIQNIAAITSFRKEKLHEFKMSFKLAIWTLPGAVIGALVAVKIDDFLFKKILGVVLIFIVLSMLFSPAANRSGIAIDAENRHKWMVYPALFGIGFYGGFIQAGVGFLLMATLFYLLRLDLLLVNVHKVFIVLIYTAPALAIFIYSGNVDWLLGLSLAAGNALGGWWAAKLSAKKGVKFIRGFLFIAVLIMAGKLLGFY